MYETFNIDTLCLLGYTFENITPGVPLRLTIGRCETDCMDSGSPEPLKGVMG
jgi:hypothetical protein